MSANGIGTVIATPGARDKPRVYLAREGESALVFPRTRLGDSFGAYRAAIDGARWDPARRLNVAPLDKVSGILKRLREAGFAVELEEPLREILEKMSAQEWLDRQAAEERLDAIDKDIKKRTNGKRALKPYQRVGVAWLLARFGALLADDMGLGKTLQALAAIPVGAPVLVVCPASVKGSWRKEVHTWRPSLPIAVLDGRANFRWPRRGEIVVVNYEILPSDIHARGCVDRWCSGCSVFLKGVPEGLVLISDEAHMLKNAKSKRTRAFRALSGAVRKYQGRTWLLTATPVLNKLPELWAILQAAGIAQEAFGSWKQFAELCGAKKGKFGMEWDGQPSPEIAERLERVMLRRKKSEVAKDLPPKTHQIVNVSIDEETIELCDKALSGISPAEFEELLQAGSGQKAIPFDRVSSIRAALAAAKIPAMLDAVKEYEEAEEPLVVFSAHRAPIECFERRAGWGVIMGDVSTSEREQIIAKFQKGELRGIAATIKAAGTGVTLHKATNMLFVDREWSPKINAQAEDRIHRLGQDNACFYKLLVANHRLDERMTEILLEKQLLIEATVDAAKPVQAEESSDEKLADLGRLAERLVERLSIHQGHAEGSDAFEAEADMACSQLAGEDWAELKLSPAKLTVEEASVVRALVSPPRLAAVQSATPQVSEEVPARSVGGDDAPRGEEHDTKGSFKGTSPEPNGQAATPKPAAKKVPRGLVHRSRARGLVHLTPRSDRRDEKGQE